MRRCGLRLFAGSAVLLSLSLASLASPASAAVGDPLAHADLGAPLDGAAVGGGTVAGEENVDDRVLRYTAPRTVISRPGSAYVKVHVNRLRLYPGDYLTVANPAGSEVHTYHGDPTTTGAPRRGDASYTEHRTTGFAAMSIDGDTAVLTLHRTGSRRLSAAALDRAGYGVRVDRIWRGWSAAEFRARNRVAICGKDNRRNAVCYKDTHPKEWNQAQAVVRLQMDAIAFCTGWRVGTTNRLMTNHHCISTAARLKTTEVQFQYQCAVCTDTKVTGTTKVGAQTLLRTNGALDYTLLELKDFAKVSGFGTFYLDVRKPAIGEKIYIAGHGAAEPKKISLYEETDGEGDCTIKRDEKYGNSIAYTCDTKPGSSGSPVILRESGKAIGLHKAGDCKDPDNNPDNIATRTDLLWPAIKDLVDNIPPPGTGPLPGVPPALGGNLG